jgi:excisionase family DNA binding protein
MEGLREEQLFFSVADVARILGFEKSTIYSRVAQGRLKRTEIDGRLRITRAELLRYIGPAATQPEAAQA